MAPPERRDPSEHQTKGQSLSTSARPPLIGRKVLARMSEVSSGSLSLLEGGRRHDFGKAEAGLPHATIEVRDARFWAAVAFRGSIGAGEAYSKGWWTSADPVAVVRVFVRNGEALTD